MPFAAVTFYPAVAIAMMVELIRLRSFQSPSQTPGQLVNKPIDAAVVDRILEPGMLPNRTVAVIPLNRHRLFRNIDDLLRRTEADHLGHLRIGLHVSVRHAHPTADCDVESL
ncbi:hypothetical protein D3C76_1477810 [compost metagenome]